MDRANEGATATGGNVSQYEALHHIIYVFGLPILGVLVGAAGFWRDSHLTALVIIATSLVVSSVYEMRVRGWGIWQIIGACVLWYVLAWIAYQIFGPNLPEETDRLVYLMPSNKPTPFSACAADFGSETPPMGQLHSLLGQTNFGPSNKENIMSSL